MLSIILIFLLFATFTVFHKYKNITVTHIFHSLIEKFSLSKNLAIDKYLSSIGLMILYQLLISIFGLTNSYGYTNYIFTYILSISHTFGCIFYGVYKFGLIQFFDNLRVKLGSNIFLYPIGIFIFILELFMNIIVKTLITPTRIIVNILIGHLLEDVLIKYKMGYFLFLVLFLKIALYIIQSYIFTLMFYKTYTDFCVKKNVNK